MPLAPSSLLSALSLSVAAPAPASSSSSSSSGSSTLASSAATATATATSATGEAKEETKACTKCTSLKRKLTRALNEGADLKDRLSASDRQVAQLLQDVQFQRTMVERYQAELLKLKATSDPAKARADHHDDQVDAVPAQADDESPSKKRKVDALSSA